MAQAASSDLPLFCERCGYMLQGLSPQRCPACSLWGLRCPECGHQQHANSIRPGLLRMLGRLRGVAHVCGALMMVGCCGLVAFIWWIAGMEWASAIQSGRVASDRDYWLLVLGALLSTWSLYGVLAHSRRRIVPVAVVLLIHTLACYVGVQTRFMGLYGGTQPSAPLLPYGFVTQVSPWFFVGALSGWAMLRLFHVAFWPARVRELLWAWLGYGRMPRINLEAIRLPAHLPFGEDVPHFCDGCGRPLPVERVSVCEACTLLQVRCEECEHVQPVSPLRPVLRESAAHAAATVLHLLTLVQGGVIFAAMFGWLVGGYECAYTYTYQSYRTWPSGYSGPFPIHWSSEEAFFAAFWAILFGIVTRTMMLRWRRGLFVGMVVGVVTAGVFAMGMAMRNHVNREPVSPFSADSGLVLLMIAGGVTVGSLVTWPGWWLFVRVMLPRKLGGRVLHWMTTGSMAELVVMEEADAAGESGSTVGRAPRPTCTAGASPAA